MADQSTPTIQQKGGDVGIGTGTPLRKLHVAGGTLAVNGSGTQYYGVNIGGGEGSNPYILIGDWHNASANLTWDSTNRLLRIDSQYSTSGAPIVFSGNDAATEYMRITGSGFVGINNNNPPSKLSVADTNQYIADITNTVTDQLTSIRIWNSAQSTAGVNTAASTIELIGKAGTSTHGRHAWVGAEGVASATYRTKLLFKIRGESNTGYQWSGASAAPIIVTMDGNGQVSFNQYTSSSSFTGTAAGVLAFDSSGNIITQSATLYPSGSGTTNYLAKWTGTNTLGDSIASESGTSFIVGTAGETKINVRSASGNGSAIFFTESSVADRYLIGSPASSGDLVFRSGSYNFSTGSEKMRLTSGGNLGIGTVSPSYNLTVVGSTSAAAVASFQNTSATGYSGAHILNNAGTLMGHWGYGNASISGGLSDLVYFGSIASKSVVFTTADTERVRITEVGNVGIKTTGPICTLDLSDSGAVISGTATVGTNMKGLRVYNTTSATQNNAVGIWFSTGPHQAGIASFRANPASTWETSLAFYTHVDALSNLNDATEKMRLTGEGSLLVGGTSTAAGGVIQAQGTSTTTISIRTTVAGNGAPRLKFYHDGNDEFVIRGGDGVAFLTSGVNVRYSMNSSGQSSYNLSSGAAAIGNGINISTQQGTYTSGHGGILQFQNEDVITAGIRGVRTTGWGSGMLFYVHNESAGNTINSTFVERMRINELGNVAIGTTTPSTRFVVYDDTQDRFNIRIQSTIANNADKYMGIGFSGEESNTKGAIFFQSYGTSYSRGKMIFALNNAQDQTNATPSNAILTLEASGAATFVSYVTATAYYESSDSRIKTLLDNTIDYSIISNVEARYYEKNGVQELGYFAQDFENILSSAVYKDDKGFLNLSYTQVHTAKIAALEARVKELESQLKNK